MSHYHQPAPEGKDPELLDIAQKRASFKNHLVSYVLVNAFCWAIWYFITFNDPDFNSEDIIMPWPLWTTLCWGIGLAYEFAEAYILHKSNPTEEEYQKLINQQTK